MKKYKFVVEVPQPDRKSYRPDRPISDLVRNQVMHLSLAEKHLEPRHRSGTDIYSIQTEQQASEYIEHVTKKIHARQTSGRKRTPAGGKKRRKKLRR